MLVLFYLYISVWSADGIPGVNINRFIFTTGYECPSDTLLTNFPIFSLSFQWFNLGIFFLHPNTSLTYIQLHFGKPLAFVLGHEQASLLLRSSRSSGIKSNWFDSSVSYECSLLVMISVNRCWFKNHQFFLQKLTENSPTQQCLLEQWPLSN